MTVLADSAPTGAGLAIVLAILLAFFAVVVGGAAWLTVAVVRRLRRRGQPGTPTQENPAPEE